MAAPLVQPPTSPFPLPYDRGDGYFADFRAYRTGISPSGWTQDANLVVAADGLDNNAVLAGLYNGLSVKDGLLEVEGQMLSGLWGWIIRSDASGNNNYTAAISSILSILGLWKRVTGSYVQIGSTPLTPVANRLYRATWQFSGNKHALDLDGKRMLEVTDTTYLNAGLIGLHENAGQRGVTRSIRCVRL